jgi:hypothetical protein
MTCRRTSVGRAQPLHEPIDVAPRRLDEQVPVCPHQDIGVEHDVIVLQRGVELIEKALAISVAAENRLTTIPAGSDMVLRPSVSHSPRPRHEAYRTTSDEPGNNNKA